MQIYQYALHKKHLLKHKKQSEYSAIDQNCKAKNIKALPLK